MADPNTWRVLSDTSVCDPNTFDTEAKAEAMFRQCDAVDPGEWRVVPYVPATALAVQRERYIAALRKALGFCYSCGGGLVADAEAPYCEDAECSIPAFGGDHPSLIDHLVVTIKAVDCESCDGGMIHNAWGEDGVTVPCPRCHGGPDA